MWSINIGIKNFITFLFIFECMCTHICAFASNLLSPVVTAQRPDQVRALKCRQTEAQIKVETVLYLQSETKPLDADYELWNETTWKLKMWSLICELKFILKSMKQGQGEERLWLGWRCAESLQWKETESGFQWLTVSMVWSVFNGSLFAGMEWHGRRAVQKIWASSNPRWVHNVLYQISFRS